MPAMVSSTSESYLLGVRRVHDEFARFHVARNAHARGRTVERSATAQQGCGRTANADAIRRILAIADERRGNDVHFLLESVRETGANGSVDHASREGALLGRARFALEITARDTADRVHLLDEVHRQRKEVVVFLLLGHNGGDEAGGVALGHQDSAGRLLGQLARFEAVLFAVQLEGFDDFFHVLFYAFSHPCALLRQGFFGRQTLTGAPEQHRPRRCRPANPHRSASG